ncbi:MAG: glycosyltransferase family 4 protein [Planctomycetota bacterium]
MGADGNRDGNISLHPPLPIKSTVGKRGGRVCIVTDEVLGPFRNGGIGTTYCAMAGLLADAGFDVTLLYTRGRQSIQGSIDSWIDDYKSRGIRLIPLPEPSERIDGSLPLHLAYRVYCWLKNERFDIVHFPEYRGVAYYSLLAKRQNTEFSNTLFCIGAHGPTLWSIEANHDFIQRSEEVEYDAIERRCVEWADVLWSPSHYLLQWMRTRHWKFPANVYVQPNLIPREIPVDQEFNTSVTKELIFFGRLESRKGIELFCDALDRVHGDLAENDIRVTFLGKPTRIGALDAIDYLKERGEFWSFAWNIQSECSHAEAIAYLRSPGKLAVIPSRLENSPLTVMECIEFRIPFLASAVGGIPELIHPDDQDHVLFLPRIHELERRLLVAIASPVGPVRPALEQTENRKHWLAWHASAKVSSESPRPRSQRIDHLFRSV